MKPLFFGTLKGLIFFIISAVTLLTVFTFIALRLDDPAKTVTVFSNAALLISAFISGRISVNADGRKLIYGICTSLADTLVILAASFLFSGLSDSALLRIFLTALLSVLGALSKKNAVRDFSTKKRKSNLKRYAAYR